MILYTCTDLLWATRIKATAEALGIPARPARSLEMLEARMADSAPTALIVDLETGDIAVELISRAVASASMRVVAFGPHVAVEALEAARQAGAHRVISRGALSERLPALLGELAATGDQPD